MNHTPTPYDIEERDMAGIKHRAIVDDCGEVICRFDFIEGEKETAEFMKTACNAHEDLVKAIKEIIKEATEVEGHIFELCQPNRGDVFSKFDNIKYVAKKALASRSKGEK